MKTRAFVVSSGPDRADRFLGRVLPSHSRRERAELFALGSVRSAGRPVHKGDVLPPGATVLVSFEDGLAPDPDLPVPILHEDAEVLAVDKPHGVPGHALRNGDRGTVANFLVARFPETVLASPRRLDAGLVHRLDTTTSGVLLAARSRRAWAALRSQFRARQVEKRYVARVSGVLDSDHEISTPIRSRGGERVRVASVGREAITRIRPLTIDKTSTVVEVEIETGVRHQIRAHLASIGHPVLGDTVYGGPPAHRIDLHATRLTFTHPSHGQRVTVTSPDPWSGGARDRGGVSR